jgi:hypothetical protein
VRPDTITRPWVRFVLTAHLRQATTNLRRTKEIEALYIELDRLIGAHKLPERTIDALFDAALGMRVRRSVYKAILRNQGDDSVSDQTATRDLQTLAAVGLLIPQGEKRGRYYTAGAEIAAIRGSIVGKRNPRDRADPFGGSSDR